MGYLQKEIDMLNAMKKDDYASMGGKDKAIGRLTRQLGAFPDYMNCVVRMEIMQPIWRAQLDGPEYRERVQAIDTERHHCHESAITAVNMLNRMSSRLGLEPFSEVDTNDRYAVADMVQEYMNEVYDAGQNRPQRQAEYSVKAHMKELDELMAGEPEQSSDGMEM